MAGSALELALALHRVPSMRHALRERPLPHDTGELLIIARGSRRALAQAAAACGEEPATVLEAARFFVQEVLLFPEADAYRVLGLDRSASEASIKAHYRALQHWLHPDRRGSDPESAYATRINVAWAQLRNADRRRAYDLADADAVASAAVPARAARVRVNEWRAQPLSADAMQWNSIAPALAALALCLWLVWLTSSEPSAPGVTDEWGGSAASGEAGAGERAERDFFAEGAIRLPAPAVVQPLSSASSPPARSPSSRTAAGTQAPAPISTGQSALRSLPEPAPQVATVAIAPVAGATAAAVPLIAQPLLSPSRSLQPRPPAATARAVSAPLSAQRPVAAPTPDTASAAPVPQQAAVVVTAAAIAPAPAAVSASDALTRVRLAQRRADQLWAYLSGGSGIPPPIWRNASALEAAERVRRGLLEHEPTRHGSTDDTKPQRHLAFSNAQWQVGENAAQVRVRVGPAEGAPASHTLHANFGWRDGQWWVEQVAMGGRY